VCGVQITKNATLNDTAKFLAGLPVKNEAFQPYIDKDFYAKYSAGIDKSWKVFERNRQSIKKWRSENLKSDYSLSVFYPFSGPDILHPLTFYPKAREIIMFGLEPTGGIPNIKDIEPAEINQQLELLYKEDGERSTALYFVLNQAFFVTTIMGRSIKPSSINGVSAIMLFFLARGGYDVLDMREVHITEDSNLAVGVSTERNAINGVEVFFTEKGSREVKSARYFTLDIADSSGQVDRFNAYTRKHQPFTSIIKSASYLMHWNTFSKIRNLILETSSSILQDDSGIPYRFFRNNSDWKVTHFGRYHRPIPVFETLYQQTLDRDNRLHSLGPLPFVYGYGYFVRNTTYHLLLAERVTEE
jgi:hypothetical protein